MSKPYLAGRTTHALVTAALATIASGSAASAQITFTVEGDWPTAARRQAAVDAMTAAVDRYNAHGGFTKTLRVTYNENVPTADGNFNGNIRFGGRFPDEGVSLHEIGHTLGMGTTNAYQNNRNASNNRWTGERGIRKVEQFDGIGTNIGADNFHFFPYGLNFSNEYNEVNFDRHVALVYEMGRDMNLNLFRQQAPNYDDVVTLTADDPNGTSSFNLKDRWSDGQFAHAGGDYSTGEFQLRTPSRDADFRFGGDSLTVNNTVSTAADTLDGLVFITPGGSNNQAMMVVDNLILDGGSVANRGNETETTFRLDGSINVTDAGGTFHAFRGRINVTSDITGTGDLTILPGQTASNNAQAVRFLSPDSTWTGNLIVDGGRFGLGNNAAFNFVLGEDGTSNSITGDATLVYLDGTFNFDLPTAPTDAVWTLVDTQNLTYGPNFDISGFAELNDVWSNGTYVFTESTGQLTLVPEPAALSLLGLGGIGLLRRR